MSRRRKIALVVLAILYLAALATKYRAYSGLIGMAFLTLIVCNDRPSHSKDGHGFQDDH